MMIPFLRLKKNQVDSQYYLSTSDLVICFYKKNLSSLWGHHAHHIPAISAKLLPLRLEVGEDHQLDRLEEALAALVLSAEEKAVLQTLHDRVRCSLRLLS